MLRLDKFKNTIGVMSDSPIETIEYKAFLQSVKLRIQSAQIKAATAVNQELLRLYWDLAE